VNCSTFVPHQSLMLNGECSSTVSPFSTAVVNTVHLWLCQGIHSGQCMVNGNIPSTSGTPPWSFRWTLPECHLGILEADRAYYMLTLSLLQSGKNYCKRTNERHSFSEGCLHWSSFIVSLHIF